MPGWKEVFKYRIVILERTGNVKIGAVIYFTYLNAWFIVSKSIIPKGKNAVDY